MSRAASSIVEIMSMKWREKQLRCRDVGTLLTEPRPVSWRDGGEKRRFMCLRNLSRPRGILALPTASGMAGSASKDASATASDGTPVDDAFSSSSERRRDSCSEILAKRADIFLR